MSPTASTNAASVPPRRSTARTYTAWLRGSYRYTCTCSSAASSQNTASNGCCRDRSSASAKGDRAFTWVRAKPRPDPAAWASIASKHPFVSTSAPSFGSSNTTASDTSASAGATTATSAETSMRTSDPEGSRPKSDNLRNPLGDSTL